MPLSRGGIIAYGFTLAPLLSISRGQVGDSVRPAGAGIDEGLDDGSLVNVEWHKDLVTPRGVDHVLPHVADLDRATRFYRILSGKEASREPAPARVSFQIGDTRLGLEQAG
jgi:hypothetical protein